MVAIREDERVALKLCWDSGSPCTSILKFLRERGRERERERR
jgi:hypothetical protein